MSSTRKYDCFIHKNAYQWNQPADLKTRTDLHIYAEVASRSCERNPAGAVQFPETDYLVENISKQLCPLLEWREF